MTSQDAQFMSRLFFVGLIVLVAFQVNKLGKARSAREITLAEQRRGLIALVPIVAVGLVLVLVPFSLPLLAVGIVGVGLVQRAIRGAGSR